MGGGRINTHMKIDNILTEGLEKVPQQLIDRCMVIVLGGLFSHMLAYTDTDDLIDVNETIKKYYGRYQQIYGKLIYTDIDPVAEENYYLPKVTLRMPMKDIDPRYNRIKSTRTTFNIDVYVGYKFLDSKGEFSLNQKTGKAMLLVDFSYASQFGSFSSAPEMIPSIITDLEGTVEHELVHGIQGLVMGVDVGKEAKAYFDHDEEGNVKGIDPVKYYTSNVEFGPNIIGAFKTFLAQIGALQQQGLRINLETLKELAMYSVDPSRPLPSYLRDFSRPEMFEVLYQSDKVKWKKAVKYFYGLLDKLIDKNFNGRKS